ncbi:DUF2218 domain-containing protein [Pseudokineococcus marinus]|uniref:DUF2218 domain-containing protein n=1 Tax=Pseudokineococcus marinus TaxID=351215 RepID=A0A849BK94_9ACTN|nr:DUF2218 domain-containing protein [Pseudokineococcus marinus]NNH23620.1 DUF2218 domain-containing protein [Pseudokineococcus marinus]
MGTTSQTTISSSSPLAPDVLVQRLVQALHGAAEVASNEDRTTLVFPPPASPVGDGPVGSAHLQAGAETVVVDCTAPDSEELSRVEDLLTTRLRTVDQAAADAVVWRRHE